MLKLKYFKEKILFALIYEIKYEIRGFKIFWTLKLVKLIKHTVLFNIIIII